MKVIPPVLTKKKNSVTFTRMNGGSLNGVSTTENLLIGMERDLKKFASLLVRFVDELNEMFDYKYNFEFHEYS